MNTNTSRAQVLAAKAKLEAIERRRDAIERPLRDRIDRLTSSIIEQELAAEERLESLIEACQEFHGKCDYCGEYLFTGDAVISDPEGDEYLCEECAPTNEELLTSWLEAGAESHPSGEEGFRTTVEHLKSLPPTEKTLYRLCGASSDAAPPADSGPSS